MTSRPALAIILSVALVSLRAAEVEPLTGPFGPAALAVSRDGARVYIAGAEARQVAVFDTARRQVMRRISTPEPPSGLALSADGQRLIVTCAAPVSPVLVVDPVTGEVVARLEAGHTALAPVWGADGDTVYVCNRFHDSVSVLSLSTRKEFARIPVGREPVAAALTPDGNRLIVACHLQNGRADGPIVAAEVVILNAEDNRVLKRLPLGNGSGLLRGVAVSPDGRFAAITHILARYHLPTTQVDRGWMNSNALSLIDLQRLAWHNTVLLDDVDRGAANPWAVGWSADGKTLVVTHAGTHELSVIDAPGLLAKLAKLPSPEVSPFDNAPDDLAFLVGLRRRVPLPLEGPRALALAGGQVFVAGFFTDQLVSAELEKAGAKMEATDLVERGEVAAGRRGEAFFNDARLCFQGWQSCASCHSSDGRVDGFNWDLLNDGLGNPKNTHSLLWSHRTPPAMSHGVRETAETAVRAGLQHILFTTQPESVPTAIDTYLKTLEPLPSPFLVKGRLSPTAERGRQLFEDRKTACADCHPNGPFTNLQAYDVGTRTRTDTETDFDTPALVELWRTAPYLHDGSAATLREVLTTRNARDQHGTTSHLTPAQVDDLAAYLLSL